MASTNYGWESQLPNVTGLDDAAAAAYINSLTVPNSGAVYVSFREFQNIQSSGSYSAMKQLFLNYITGVEQPHTGYWVGDMYNYLMQADVGYNINAQPFYQALLAVYGTGTGIGPAGNFYIASGFMANYVSGLMPPLPAYPIAYPSQIATARGY